SPAHAGVEAEAPVSEEEEERRVPPAPPKYGRRWAGGILVGALLGGAACVALWAFRVEPPKGLRQLVGTDTESPKEPSGQPGGKQPPKVAQATVDYLLHSGGFSQAEPPAINDADVGDRVKRGRYLLLQYLSRTDPKDYKPTNEAVTKAMADLEEGVKQGNADAYLWKGFAYEALNNLPEAQKVYEAGAKKFDKDPRF